MSVWKRDTTDDGEPPTPAIYIQGRGHHLSDLYLFD